jgi:hypothetical protein
MLLLNNIMEDNNGKYNDIRKCREDIKNMSKSVLEMENSFDYSMKGFFIDTLVTNYCELKLKETINKFEFIMDNQKKDNDTYGDMDESFNKLPVIKFNYDNTEDFDYNVTGVLVKDIFQGNNFVVIKVVESTKKADNFISTTYHVRRVTNGEIKKINYSKYVTYGDIRDDNFVFTLEHKFFTPELKLSDSRGMITYYRYIYDFIWVIDCIHRSLTDDMSTDSN